ncbi:MAG: CDP-alcohol phosphatidyltransferase family protein [Elusimicrobia bacterium]|nr:CDP-alcohol phosphatidyltransferase family protein [Elusimicrobiota bacterium]
MNSRLIIKDHKVGSKSILLTRIREQLVLHRYIDILSHINYDRIIICTENISEVKDIIANSYKANGNITYVNNIDISESDNVIEARYIYHWYKLARLLRKGKKNFEKAIRWEMRTEEDIKNVETVLLRYHMYPIATRINLEIAKLFVIPLKNSRVHPNHITYISLVSGLLACTFFLLAEYKYILLGALFLQIQCTLDFADGYLARLKNMSSDFGMYLDGVVNKVVESFSLIAISYGLFLKSDNSIHLSICLLVLLGYFMILVMTNLKNSAFGRNKSAGFNREATLYVNTLIKKTKSVYTFLETWDTRVYLICLFAVLNRLDMAMIYFAVDFNIRWLFNTMKVIIKSS